MYTISEGLLFSILNISPTVCYFQIMTLNTSDVPTPIATSVSVDAIMAILIYIGNTTNDRYFSLHNLLEKMDWLRETNHLQSKTHLRRFRPFGSGC